MILYKDVTKKQLVGINGKHQNVKMWGRTFRILSVLS